jgi:hypothetical protein
MAWLVREKAPVITAWQIALSAEGTEKAKALAKRPSFATLVERQKAVKKTFGGKSGTVLKNLIYKLFDEEVGKRTLGQVITK